MNKVRVPTTNQPNPQNKPDFGGVQIALDIQEISSAMKRLSHTRLKRELIVTLIHDKSKLGKKEIELVLNNLEQLEEIWLKKDGK